MTLYVLSSETCNQVVRGGVVSPSVGFGGPHHVAQILYPEDGQYTACVGGAE